MSEQQCKCGKHDWERAFIGPARHEWGTTVSTWRYCKQCLTSPPHDTDDDRAAEEALAGVA